ncbi:hypothetical protein L2Y90_32645 (plasmid) [Burkholderia pyrrocinia]|uniref:hypothetical protein n=1 Tax=Burkholderia pyrrocinia TaxID=60550 RepID=UPI00215AD9BB|nr:hypothetical protein [Burkholderia pyrrocinia]UVE70568.1 hypothetical protein L2Y90_32645 [Burkholderia pyrrocinia]
MKHLQILAPDVFAQLESVDGAQLRWICFRVCEYAATANGLLDTVVQEALGYLKSRQECQCGWLKELDELVNSFDDKYFDLKEQAEDTENSRERESLLLLSGEYFRKARVVAAICAATDKDPFEAATEAIYEAAASVEKNEIVFDLVMSLL